MTIHFGRSKYSAANIVVIGDSIPAGYVAFGTYGVCARLQRALPDARVLNYCVPGQQTTFQTGTPFFAYTYGMFNGSVLPNLNYSKRKNILIQIGPGNDYARTPTLPYDAQTQNFVVGRTVTGATSGAHGLIINDFDSGSTGFMWLDWTTVVGTFQDNEIITGSGVNGGSATVNGTLDPTGPALPADVYAARIDMAGRAAAVGAVNFICTLPPRATNYQTKLDAENVFIRTLGGTNGYTAIELALDAQLSVCPSPMYGDPLGHWSDAGEQRAADIILPYIQAII